MPWRDGATPRRYLPDFIVRLDDGRGPDDPLNLVVEIKGQKDATTQIKAETMRTLWVPGVNNLKTYGRWDFIEFSDCVRDRRELRCAGWRQFMAKQRGCGIMAKVPQDQNRSNRSRTIRRGASNVPTAELQSLADQQEELAPRPPKHYPRARPLAEGRNARARSRSRSADRLERGEDQPDQRADDAACRDRHGRDRRRATGLARQGPAGLVRPRRQCADALCQEKVHPKAIIDDLKRQTDAAREARSDAPDLFADFNGLTDPKQRAEFYQHASTGRTG